MEQWTKCLFRKICIPYLQQCTFDVILPNPGNRSWHFQLLLYMHRKLFRCSVHNSLAYGQTHVQKKVRSDAIWFSLLLEHSFSAHHHALLDPGLVAGILSSSSNPQLPAPLQLERQSFDIHASDRAVRQVFIPTSDVLG